MPTMNLSIFVIVWKMCHMFYCWWVFMMLSTQDLCQGFPKPGTGFFESWSPIAVNHHNNEEIFLPSQITSIQKLSYTETLKKKADLFFSGHKQNASLCKNLRFERGHVGILFLSFHPQTNGFWDPLATIFAKGPFILEVLGGPTGILGLTVWPNLFG